MTDKSFEVRKGLIVANTVLVTFGSNVGIGNTAPAHVLSVNGPAYFNGNLQITGTFVANGGVGTSGQVLTSNGTASYWSTPTSGVGGTNTQIMYNDSGTLAGDAGLTFNNTNDTLSTNAILTTTSVNAASHTAGASFTANTTTVAHTGNISGGVIKTTAGEFIANSTAIAHTGTSLVINSVFTVNSTAVNTTSLGLSTNTAIFGTAFYCYSNGNIGLGNNAPVHKLAVNGITYFGANVSGPNTSTNLDGFLIDCGTFG